MIHTFEVFVDRWFGLGCCIFMVTGFPAICVILRTWALRGEKKHGKSGA